jgi:23S rRNA (adenine2030-N6)-methyltransferase
VNYRHAFHAGNHADVLKHLLLVHLLEALQRKDKGFLFVDTHAGRGQYPIDPANPGGEWHEGIGRVLARRADAPEGLRHYLDLVVAAGGGDATRLAAYPGSPSLAASLLRPQDRAVFCELQRVEAKALTTELTGVRNAQVREGDGYAALKALLPPPERRALVLVDPPYETQAAEFDTAKAAILTALERFPSCTLALWYPIKEGPTAQRFLEAMRRSGVRRQWVLELCIHADDSHVGLNGSGLWVVNPPWQFEQALQPAMPWLHKALSPAGRGRWRCEEWVPE